MRFTFASADSVTLKRMCGFAGVFFHDRSAPVDAAKLEQMRATLHHRGPDGSGTYVGRGVGLAFARLAIIDLEAGDQPLANDDGSVWIAFNGEIYNYRELRDELKRRGRHFRTHSDTEVIVRAYEEWGEHCVDHLRGIFAFAIWDEREEKLMLARDRSGIKPLHLAFRQDQILFASEAKALLAHGDVSSELDIVGYLGGATVESSLEHTTFEAIRQLGGGCILVAQNGAHRIQRYWSYSPALDEGTWSAEELIERCRALVEEAVLMQLVADVPVAASLSGGVDSAAIVAAIVRAGRGDVRTYTVSFEGDATGDLRHARLLASELGIHHEEVSCRFDASTVDLFSHVAWLAEGEFDLGFVARYQLAERVHADGAKVLLTGQGIDEILTGYYASFQQFRRACVARQLRGKLLPSYRGWPMFGDRVVDRAGEWLEDDARGDAAWARITSAQLRADHARLSTGLLRFEDRMGMGGSVEVRVPLLDHQLLELCASVPESGRMRLFNGKALLREAVRPWLPQTIAERPKVAFNATSRALTDLLQEAPAHPLRELLTKTTVGEKGYFEWRYCKALLDARDFISLDHVLIIHLLDELFVRGTAVGAFRASAATAAAR